MAHFHMMKHQSKEALPFMYKIMAATAAAVPVEVNGTVLTFDLITDICFDRF